MRTRMPQEAHDHLQGRFRTKVIPDDTQHHYMNNQIMHTRDDRNL